MVYKFPDIIQRYNFSCLEELKCDMIENVLRIKEDVEYNCVNILLHSDLARKLYTMLLGADVNGFQLKLFEEMTNEEVTQIMTQQDYVVISITNQGTVFVEEQIYIEPDFPNDFWYAQEDLFDKIEFQVKKYDTNTLVFTLS